MKMQTKKDLLKELPELYRGLYPRPFTFTDGRCSEAIYQQLIMQQPLTEQKVKDIMGHSDWISNKCDECCRDFETVVILGEDVDNCINTASICFECLKEAINKFEK